jgi:hypothetical protein
MSSYFEDSRHHNSLVVTEERRAHLHQSTCCGVAQLLPLFKNVGKKHTKGHAMKREQRIVRVMVGRICD